METKDRLLKFIEYLRLTPSAFEKEVQISNGYVNNIRSSIGPTVLKKILEKYPDLNKVWLLHGDGTMLIEGSSNVTQELNSCLATVNELRKDKEALMFTIELLKKQLDELEKSKRQVKKTG